MTKISTEKTVIKAISICLSCQFTHQGVQLSPDLSDVSFNLKDGNFIVNKYKVKCGVIGKFGVYFKIAICNVRN